MNHHHVFGPAAEADSPRLAAKWLGLILLFAELALLSAGRPAECVGIGTSASRWSPSATGRPSWPTIWRRPRLSRRCCRFRRTGEPVLWPNPIPQQLIPPDEREAGRPVALVDGQSRIRRTGTEEGELMEKVDPGSTVLGYQHPGGGGKSRWGNYHVYRRRFDRLTRFRTIRLLSPCPAETPRICGPVQYAERSQVRNVSASRWSCRWN
jgi:hypothetical protein